MKQIVINHFHIHGNYIAGDHIDIHDNTSVNFYQGENTKETSTHETCVEDVVPIVEQAPCPFLVTEKLTELGRVWTRSKYLPNYDHVSRP